MTRGSGQRDQSFPIKRNHPTLGQLDGFLRFVLTRQSISTEPVIPILHFARILSVKPGMKSLKLSRHLL